LIFQVQYISFNSPYLLSEGISLNGLGLGTVEDFYRDKKARKIAKVAQYMEHRTCNMVRVGSSAPRKPSMIFIVAAWA
jgi:hypothetical protein